ncbi:hypothetical protein [Zhongshania aquimaris]|uniref:Uncharacterized protein n=1 Tax=Zhongshania aquimaris TaxID=2857107 RepID=A0ABS6VVE3_9GAMM|nr:hypothetical protein [Zhongshania aquimaris]MBW2942298.1 hypothetical protein [Zhongshania aquimaris]|tara:strand:- start:1289 stop:1594 length:306 start_codon:yes stop_codon:yes gene_type:complete
MTAKISLTGLMLLCTSGLAAGDADREVNNVSMGMTVHGDAAAAVGLYLMPWSNEQVSDIDRPPRLLSENIEQIDVGEFRKMAEWDQARRDYQIWRLQRNNW